MVYDGAFLKQVALSHIGLIIFLIIQFCSQLPVRYFNIWLLARCFGNLSLHLFSSGDLKQNICVWFEGDIGISFSHLVLMESAGSINKKHEMGS